MNKHFLNHIWLILKKDILTELRTKEIFLSMFIFAVLELLLFNFSFEPNSEETLRLASGFLWITFAFAGILGLNRTAALEKENLGMESLSLSPVSSESIFLAKCLTNFFIMFLSQILIFPVFSIFFNFSFLQIDKILLISLLGACGFCTVGTLLSTLALHTRLRDILLPILLFPIIVPLFMSSVECTNLILKSEFHFTSAWFKLLIAYDVIFLVIGLMLFQYVIEE